MQIDERFTLFTATIAGLYRSVQVLKGLALAQFGLRGTNVNCLFFLKRNPEGLTVSELSVLCQEDKAAVSRCMQELKESAMVSLSLENGKRYRGRFTLTEKGLGVAKSLYDTITAAVVEGGRNLTEEERDCFYRCLEKIQENLQDYICRYPAHEDS